MTEAQQWLEGWKAGFKEAFKERVEEGLLEGRKEGQIEVLARQFKRKLGRPLTEPECSTLAERFDLLGPDRLDDVRLELSADTLAAWLADPSAR